LNGWRVSFAIDGEFSTIGRPVDIAGCQIPYLVIGGAAGEVLGVGGSKGDISGASRVQRVTVCECLSEDTGSGEEGRREGDQRRSNVHLGYSSSEEDSQEGLESNCVL